MGAVASIVLSFIPFSPALGGAVAGYLQRGDTDANLRTGALAGLPTAIPVAMVCSSSAACS